VIVGQEISLFDVLEGWELLVGLGIREHLVAGSRHVHRKIHQALRPTLKPVLKAAMQRLRAYAIAWEREDRERDQERAEKLRNYDEDAYAYPWLNDQMTKALRLGGASFRPHFTWGVLHAAHLARAIGVPRISVIEFGVAGGNGLVSLERIAGHVESVLGVGIDVYGFDTGTGLPKPVDYRDLPNLWRESAFSMDVARLTDRLKKARLILGRVEDTLRGFVASGPAPVGFISFDLDYYSSTVHALVLLASQDAILLPRVHCYFDDIMAFTYSEFTGERLAIAEFNAKHEMRKLAPIHGLRYYVPPAYAHASWTEQFYLAHLFDHQLYNHHDGLQRRYAGAHWELRPGHPGR
jgi:hypothetical protein